MGSMPHHDSSMPPARKPEPKGSATCDSKSTTSRPPTSANGSTSPSRSSARCSSQTLSPLRNVRRSLAPGGKLVMVVWHSKAENEWLYRAQTITERFLARPQEYDAPTCGPGPFSMADADTISGILTAAGFDHISLRRCDMPISIGANIGDAVEFRYESRSRRGDPPPGRRARHAPPRSDRRSAPLGLPSPNGTDPTASQPPPRHGSFRRSPELSAAP